MNIKDSRGHIVWKIKEKNGFKNVDLGDGKKNKDGTWDNFTWFNCGLFSNAKDLEINEGDTLTIISGLVQKRKYEGKYYDNIVIFEAEVTKKAEPKSFEDELMEVSDSSEIPF